MTVLSETRIILKPNFEASRTTRYFITLSDPAIIGISGNGGSYLSFSAS